MSELTRTRLSDDPGAQDEACKGGRSPTQPWNFGRCYHTHQYKSWSVLRSTNQQQSTREKRRSLGTSKSSSAPNKKKTPSESEEERTQHFSKDEFSAFDSIFSSISSSLPSILPNNHGWQPDRVCRRLQQFTLGGRVGKSVVNQLNSWARARHKRIRVIRHPDSTKECKPYPSSHQVTRTGSFSNSANYRNYPPKSKPPAHPRVEIHTCLFLVGWNCASVCAPVLLCVKVHHCQVIAPRGCDNP